MERRGLFSEREWPVFLLIALAAVAALVVSNSRPAGSTAVVELDGQVLMSRQLAGLTEPESVEIAGVGGIVLTVEFSPGGARVVDSNCPDGTCVRTGQLSRAGETAVCLPGRVVLRIEGPEAGQGIDAETY